MKKSLAVLVMILLAVSLSAQFPQKVSYQAVVRNTSGKLVQNGTVGIRLTVLQGSESGTPVYSETHSATTNVNGLVSLELGNGSPALGVFSDILWANGPYFLRTEIDPAGGQTYTVNGASQLISVPYALYSRNSADAFSGDYNDLKNKPITDGSETKIQGSGNITVIGAGTSTLPYVISGAGNGFPYYDKVVITSSQVWIVPTAVSKIRVELWGGAGGGGGAGAYSYSYSLNNGGDGGSGGYTRQDIPVAPNQSYNVVIGAGGYAGSNAYYAYPGYYGDTDGTDGGDTWFGPHKAAGGTGGKRGGYATSTVNGLAGIAGIGNVTGYADPSNSNVLNVYTGLARSYLSDRILTSKSGKGGSLSSYSWRIPTGGEAGAAVITLFE